MALQCGRWTQILESNAVQAEHGRRSCRLPVQIAAAAPRGTIRASRGLTQSQEVNCSLNSVFKTGLWGRKHFVQGHVRAISARAPGAGARALFTGLVEELGKVQELRTVENDGVEMTFECSVVLEGTKLGDSIAVNGTCLTVIRLDENSFAVGLAPETLRKTSLGELEIGSFVNLERSVSPSTRMGGHFVQGHVDGTGTIVSFEPEGDSLWVKVKTSPEILKYIVPKGYIAVDGTSLTVVDVLDNEGCFTFMLIAYTQQKIVIPLKKVGNKVNLETDIMGKYVDRFFQTYRASVLQAT
ncbi:riboflavin synthase [Marchantia polymorpha subsp. ruderalis]|uniref:Riboflavin synthase n=1 Tax=Marchantia polymorpha TaxID=3197 RepID=A0A2R6XB03_MARPO|nr:hypothetical protein MARPO_0026s0114 [Marchantia polymorpha]BBN02079.1 hypothetical protein Mp_2g12570 [Marchantia polymorpha subsp. ruderalis]|eukprot:PTQ43242.1 hypothetical protein MARPO_0026s0114 [Marchantia polymorpha]